MAATIKTPQTAQDKAEYNRLSNARLYIRRYATAKELEEARKQLIQDLEKGTSDHGNLHE